MIPSSKDLFILNSYKHFSLITFALLIIYNSYSVINALG